jgi:hypothetical protein
MLSLCRARYFGVSVLRGRVRGRRLGSERVSEGVSEEGTEKACFGAGE